MKFRRTAGHGRPPRLRGVDYGTGTFLVTICTHRKLWLLGEKRDGHLLPTPAGLVAFNCWKAIPLHFSHVQVLEFSLMPDHVHGILRVQAGGAGHAPRPLSIGKKECQRLINTELKIPPPSPGSLGVIIRSYKSAVTRLVNFQRAETREPLWRSSFHEKILNGPQALFAASRYVRSQGVVPRE